MQRLKIFLEIIGNFILKFKNMIKKIKRTMTSVLPVSKSRMGNCNECGECCRLPYTCPFLKEENGQTLCSIYSLRPLNCRKYPRTDSECITRETCGFRFANNDNDSVSDWVTEKIRKLFLNVFRIIQKN